MGKKNIIFDAIFSTDGDGDRPLLLADENGEWLEAMYWAGLAAEALSIEALAT